MCGIAGFIEAKAEKGPKELLAEVNAMTDAMLHRGPDSGGHWLSAEAGVGMGFRRLAIIDLSPSGNQPMTSSCERYVITYNGEIYNYQALRQILESEGRRLRGQSDTEVMLEGFSAWGVEETLERLIGMFAIALWDKKKRELTLIRDRLGIKPLYFGIQNSMFLYGSELKALRAKKGWTARMNRAALTQYLRYNYVPAPYTIYDGIFKLEPGCILRYRPGIDREPRVERYWNLDHTILKDRAAPAPKAAVERLEPLLRDAVERRMVADVPLGVMLSGGVDSSVVAALMQECSSRPIKSYTIGFDNVGYNEADQARAVAEHLGTDHTELTLTSEDARNLIPQMPEWHDEPFADSSALPTWLVSKLARDHVTVALSGDGGDEVFFGYNRYRAAATAWGKAKSVPGSVRSIAAGGLRALPTGTWDSLSALIPSGKRPRMVGDKMHKLADLLASGSEDDAYRALVSHWDNPTDLTGLVEPELSMWRSGAALSDFTERMAYYDTLSYLPGDILTKVDRASMACSLEARVPLLDHRIVEYAWSLPKEVKIRDGVGKWPLRQVLYHYVPRELVDRPKAGFAVPLADWLRGPLKEWAFEMLSVERLRDRTGLKPEPILRAFRDHLKGDGNHAEALWNILMLQSWMDRWSPAD